MGIPTDPGLDEYGNDCLTCFPPNLTPKKLYATFAGIQFTPGPLWGTPMNGTYELNQKLPAPNIWEYKNGADIILFYLYSTSSRIYFTTAEGYDVFYKINPTKCSYAFTNQHQAPPAIGWYGGKCQISWKEPVFCPSHAAVLQQMVIARQAGTMVEVGPIDDQNFWLRAADRPRSTNLEIKFDLTHFDQWLMFEK